MDGTPNRRKIAAFSNFSCVMWRRLDNTVRLIVFVWTENILKMEPFEKIQRHDDQVIFFFQISLARTQPRPQVVFRPVLVSALAEFS